MGIWGAAIFSDDTAQDVRDCFTDLVANGMEASKATKELVAAWPEVVKDREDGPVFWLALAATQWKLGRVVERVRDRAIKIIDSGRDLKRWEEEGDARLVEQRRRHLAKLRNLLRSAPPPAKRLRPRRKVTTAFKAGDVAVYHLSKHTAVRFLVFEVSEDSGGAHSDIQLLSRDDGVPFRKKLIQLDSAGNDGRFMMVSREPSDQIVILRRGVKIVRSDPRYVRYGSVIFWKDFPKYVRKWLKTQE